jgi:hypothetical protein
MDLFSLCGICEDRVEPSTPPSTTKVLSSTLSPPPLAKAANKVRVLSWSEKQVAARAYYRKHIDEWLREKEFLDDIVEIEKKWWLLFGMQNLYGVLRCSSRP